MEQVEMNKEVMATKMLCATIKARAALGSLRLETKNPFHLFAQSISIISQLGVEINEIRSFIKSLI